MAEFVSNLASPSWWFGVVVVGVLINIASQLVQRHLDKQLSAVSTRWRLRSESKKAKRTQTIELLRANPTSRYLYALSELRLRMIGLFFLIVAVMCSIIISVSRDLSIAEFAILYSGLAFTLLEAVSRYSAAADRKNTLCEALGDDVADLYWT